jgi:hypothetical protein
MAKEPRRSQRVGASIPVRLDNSAAGVTRDISPNGVYFVIDEKLESGQTIRFTMEFDDPGGGVLHLDCIGRIVRIEENGGKAGVAVAIVESRLARREAGTEPMSSSSAL